MTADVGLADPAPRFTIGDGVCSSSADSNVALPDSSDGAALANSLTAEGESTPPLIVNFNGIEQAGKTWLFTGTLTDDGPVQGRPVWFTFNGNYKGMTSTGTGGAFSFSFYVGNDWGVVQAVAYGSDGSPTQPAYFYVSDSPEPPEIHNFVGQPAQGGMWLFTGSVTDDEQTGGLSVYIYFNGEYKGSATTTTNGSFSLAFYVGDDWGMADATAYDSDGLQSETASYYVY